MSLTNTWYLHDTHKHMFVTRDQWPATSDSWQMTVDKCQSGQCHIRSRCQRNKQWQSVVSDGRLTATGVILILTADINNLSLPPCTLASTTTTTTADWTRPYWSHWQSDAVVNGNSVITVTSVNRLFASSTGTYNNWANRIIIILLITMI